MSKSRSHNIVAWRLSVILAVDSYFILASSLVVTLELDTFQTLSDRIHRFSPSRRDCVLEESRILLVAH